MHKPARVVLNSILCIFGLCVIFFRLISLFLFSVWVNLRPISCSFVLSPSLSVVRSMCNVKQFRNLPNCFYIHN